MRDRKLDRLFLRFRTQGDVAALGQVFDATAPELMRVGMSLVSDPGEVDDLLQATYLTAIERAPQWDAGRRLVPWLLGILVNHAHDLRRKRGRVVEPDRLDERIVEDPADAVTRSELAEMLRRTLAELPARYREVLQPFVEGGERPADIAARLGRPPGTVRMQIHRGLDLLRKGLPASFALGALASTAGRGLGAVRAEVLACGSAHASALTGASAASSGGTAASHLTFGGITMSKKLALVAAATLVLGGLTLIAQLSAGPASAPRSDSQAATSPGTPSAAGPAPTVGGDTLLAGGSAIPAASSGPEEARRDLRIIEHDAALTGLSGRVVEADGTPVADLPVVLYELSHEMLRAPQVDAKPAELEIARTRTGGDGTFTLSGARASAAHAIGVDPRGARPFLSLVDAALLPGRDTTLSDIVLPPVRTIVGRVVDEKGAPLEGVRVRAGRLPLWVDWDLWAPAAAGMPVWILVSPFQLVATAPPEFEQVETLLPFPQTRTGPDGAFELPGAPASGSSLILDHPGRVSLVERLPGARQGSPAYDMQTLELSRGQVIHGRVLDSDGSPVDGAEVRAGASPGTLGFAIAAEVALLASSTTSDATGQFELAGIDQEAAKVALAARRSPAHPWVTLVLENTGAQVIELPEESSIPVRVEDPEGGPVSGASLRVGRPGLLAGRVPGGALLDPRESFGRIEELGGGQYVVHELPRGTYLLDVSAEGLAATTQRLRITRRTKEQVVQLEGALDRSVEVHDAATGVPVERARIELLQGAEGSLVAEAYTNGDGRAVLAGIPLALPEDLHMHVDHPAYGPRQVPVELGPGGQRVDLEAPGTLRVRILGVTGEAATPMVVGLSPRTGGEGPSWLTSRLGTVEAGGEVLLGPLTPGTWDWQLTEPFLKGDLLDLLVTPSTPDPIQAGVVDVKAGEETLVEVELGSRIVSTLPRGDATLAGSVLLDGAAVPHLSVKVELLEEGIEGGAETELGLDGTFRLEGLPPGRARITIFEEEPDMAIRWKTVVDLAEVELQPGQTTQQDFRWQNAFVSVRVEDQAGEPIAGTTVHAMSKGVADSGSWDTGSAGVAHVELRRTGAWELWLSDTDHGTGRIQMDLGRGDNGKVTLVVDPGSLLGGRVTVPGDVAASAERAAMLGLYGSKGARLVRLEMSGGWTELEVRGLEPGHYRAKLTVPGADLAPIEFDLPPEGRTDFEFAFERE